MNFHKPKNLRYCSKHRNVFRLFVSYCDEYDERNILLDAYGNSILKWNKDNTESIRDYLKGIL